MNISDKRKAYLLKEYGTWALVTGASSGIGRAFAQQLAAAGFNLFVHGRNQQRLSKLKQFLVSQYGVEVIEIQADFTEASSLETVISAVGKREIGLMVLSAGFGTSGLFQHSDQMVESQMLHVNCSVPLSLCRWFANKTHQGSRRGIILLSSIVAFQGVPYASNYAATKAYIQILGEGLHAELKNLNIDVLNIAPGPVKTAFAKRAELKMGLTNSADIIARSGLMSLGKATTIKPGPVSKLLYSALTLPRSIRTLILGKVMQGMNQGYRNAIDKEMAL